MRAQLGFLCEVTPALGTLRRIRTQGRKTHRIPFDEVIVQGDEGPFGGVAQVFDCHGVTVGHQERKEEEVEQEVESDGEKTLKERCACPWMG